LGSYEPGAAEISQDADVDQYAAHCGGVGLEKSSMLPPSSAGTEHDPPLK
jgi:hypothetical protein